LIYHMSTSQSQDLRQSDELGAVSIPIGSETEELTPSDELGAVSIPIRSESEELRAQLALERQKTASLEVEVTRLKNTCVDVISKAEAEEECMINRMMKRLTELKHEKEQLAMEIEREEELLTNNLQKRLVEAQKARSEAESREHAMREELDTIKARLSDRHQTPP